MKRSLGWGMTVAAAVVLTAQPVAAQLQGIPVYFSPKGGTGFTVAADFGKGLNDDATKSTAFAARAALGVGPFGVGLGVGSVKPRNGDAEINYAGHVSMRLIGGALIPVAVSLQGGLGVLSIDAVGGSVKTVNVPLGVGFGLNIPTPGFGFEPWIAPRFSISRTSVGGSSATQTGFGLSGGVNLSFLMGLGVHVAFDWTKLGNEALGTATLLERKPATIGIGLNYTFRLPGLPGVPLVPGV